MRAIERTARHMSFLLDVYIVEPNLLANVSSNARKVSYLDDGHAGDGAVRVLLCRTVHRVISTCKGKKIRRKY